jgi:hypothetical protein
MASYIHNFRATNPFNFCWSIRQNIIFKNVIRSVLIFELYKITFPLSIFTNFIYIWSKFQHFCALCWFCNSIHLKIRSLGVYLYFNTVVRIHAREAIGKLVPIILFCRCNNRDCLYFISLRIFGIYAS